MDCEAWTAWSALREKGFSKGVVRLAEWESDTRKRGKMRSARGNVEKSGKMSMKETVGKGEKAKKILSFDAVV